MCLQMPMMSGVMEWRLASLIARTEGIETTEDLGFRGGVLPLSRASSPAPRALKLCHGNLLKPGQGPREPHRPHRGH